ncbi:MAG: hypothetical protein ACYS0K_01220, partial [Planctomycetota bacterium]
AMATDRHRLPFEGPTYTGWDMAGAALATVAAAVIAVVLGNALAIGKVCGLLLCIWILGSRLVYYIRRRKKEKR